MAGIQPFPALRYAPDIDLSTAVCPPFDVISPEEQRGLNQRSPHNAVRLELALPDGDPYARAADTLRRWLSDGVLQQDGTPALYLFRHRFQHGGRAHSRRVLFARLRLEPWDRRVVLPHEHTFGGPKEDRLKLLRALRVNTSPVYLLCRDQGQQIGPLLGRTEVEPALTTFGLDGEPQALWRIDDPEVCTALADLFRPETLYVADGHHRYETALAYRDERRAPSARWTGDEPENFALAALTAADDPGLLVLPIHRLARVDTPLEDVLKRLVQIFDVQTVHSGEALLSALGERGRSRPAFGLAAAGSPDHFLLSLRDPSAAHALMPRDTSPAWRGLDYVIAAHAVLRHGLAMTDAQMGDTDTLWYTEDAAQALAAVRAGAAHYALLLNPVPVQRILAVADAGERMPQKSTFFYPKVPTGLVFNPLEGVGDGLT